MAGDGPVCEPTERLEGIGTGKTPKDTNAPVKRFKEELKGDNVSIKTYKQTIHEAIQIIKSLQKSNGPLVHTIQSANKKEDSTISKILQEIRQIKATISQTQTPTQGQRQMWASVASKRETTGTTINIHDDQEKKEIARLSSKELVKKIGLKEVIGTRQMMNGQVRVYFAEERTKELMEQRKEWTLKLAASAKMANPSYQVLIHDMPFSFQPEDPEYLKELQKANEMFIQGIQIQ
ncbi:hypothetical protein EV44_g3415 [Erysiphe necator]|uniref:Uncharacterized protein n=1 Tax=Uncinula necator TaxID=52586 RepID=A0A0B1PDG0_UNCNE|nr:hypothetical protein EV44_g3415 [Erysiphe necator]